MGSCLNSNTCNRDPVDPPSITILYGDTDVDVDVGVTVDATVDVDVTAGDEEVEIAGAAVLELFVVELVEATEVLALLASGEEAVVENVKVIPIDKVNNVMMESTYMIMVFWK
jgi:hypothetical protein